MAIAQTHTPEAFQVLRAAFAKAHDPWFRKTVLAAIALTRQQEAIAWLLDLIANEDDDADGAYEALAHDGRVSFRRTADGSYERIAVSGRDPLGDQSTAKFAPLADELAHPFPHRSENAYPHAFDQIAQLFDAPAAPDLCVLHSAAHNWEDQGGHLGEHGSLGLVQARAPFVLALTLFVA